MAQMNKYQKEKPIIGDDERSGSNNLNPVSIIDAKTTNKAVFNDYCNNMAITAKNPHHPKLSILLKHLKDCHNIGIDIGAGTGHVSDCIIKQDEKNNYISRIYAVDMEKCFIDSIKTLNNNKIITIQENACKDHIFSLLPKKVDFLIFNSVIHELISYGCNYNIEQFWLSIWPRWLSIINNNGYVFVRDFIGVNNSNNKPITISIKRKNKKNYQQIKEFLKNFKKDWKTPRKELNYKWNKKTSIIKFKNYDILLEVLLSFRWGHLNKLQYDGVIAEQFINFNTNSLQYYTEKHGFKLIDYQYYLGQDYSNTFNKYFGINKDIQSHLHSKGVFLFQKCT